jgi:hypothetical protein
MRCLVRTEGDLEPEIAGVPRPVSTRSRSPPGLPASTVPIYSNDLLRAVIASNAPQDVANASTNGYNRVEYQYNTQGQQLEVKDENGTIHD